MKVQQENLDQIIRKNFPKDIAFKRVHKGQIIISLLHLNFFVIFFEEISMLSSLNNNFYKVSILNSPIGLKILVIKTFFNIC